MATPVRFGRFELRVRLVLVLLLVFLAVLDLLNIYLLGDARKALERSERERAAAGLREVVAKLGPEALLGVLEIGGTQGRMSATAMRRAAVGFGWDRVALLDRAGRQVLSSGPPIGLQSSFDELQEDDRAALAAGRPATGEMRPSGGGEETRLTAFVPLVDRSGRMVGVVEGVRPVRELGRLVRRYRQVLTVQVVGVAIIAALVLFFAQWVSRPYRRLAAAVGEAGLTDGKDGDAPEPDELASALRTMVTKLREQDDTLRTVGREGGSLGDLVRFAAKSAEAMATGVLVVDRQGRVAAMNPSAGRLLGHDRGDPRGLPLEEVTRSVRGLPERVRGCLDSGVGASREVLDVRAENGRPGHLGVAISPASGWDGKVAGALVLMTDLTEIRKLQEQARLRDNLAAVGRLSAGIAHEFRNALGTILGYARMLEKQEDPRVRGPAREIGREVDSVGAAVDEFLLYARPPEPARVRVPIERVIQGCAATARDPVVVEVEGEFGDVLGDEGLLRRAFENLLRNAADAAGGPETPVRVRITGRRVGSGRTLQIDVEDDGPGIPPEQRDQVFVPFFTTRSRGTGLGLALVQRTIVDLGGSIEVTQGTMGGASFRIRLPLVA